MCYDMRRFEKIAENKKQREKEQEFRFSVEDNSSSRSKRLKKA
jgi:hypothetical protein